MRKRRVVFLVILGVLLPACQQILPDNTLPTVAPTAPVPTRNIQANETPVPTATPTTVAAEIEAEDVEASATPTPTFTPRPSATPDAVEPFLNFQTPVENSSFLLGSQLTAGGFAQLNPEQSIWISLISNDGRLLIDIEAVATLQSSNTYSWQGTLTVPPHVNGPVRLVGTVRDTDNQILSQAERPVFLALDTTTEDRFMLMREPVIGQIAVSGYYLQMQGTSLVPSGNFITVEIWHEQCRTLADRVGFSVGGGGAWYALPVVPVDVTGPACVLAYAGRRGDPNWREAQITISILPPDDPDAAGIYLLQPRENMAADPGQTFTANGTALNPVDDVVMVTVSLENGQILAQEEVEVSPRGYWEIEITLPADVEGVAALTVRSGEAGDVGHAEIQRLFTIGDPDTDL
jgi:hypothetical protein